MEKSVPVLYTQLIFAYSTPATNAMETNFQNRMTAPAVLVGPPSFFGAKEIEQLDLKKVKGEDKISQEKQNKKQQQKPRVSSCLLQKGLRKYVSKVVHIAEETDEQRTVEEFRHKGGITNHFKLHGNTVTCTRRVTITMTAN